MRYRVKLVPSVDGSVLAVVQVRWLGLFWQDYDALSNNLHKKYWKLMETYRNLHQLNQEITSAEEDVNNRVQEVKRFGDPLRAIGPVWDDHSLPVFVKRHHFVAPPDKATLDKVRKAIQGGTYTDPDDLGIKWPPTDRGVAVTGGKRSAFLLAKHYMDALTGGLVRVGEPYDHVVKYHKPDQQQGKNQQKQGNNQQNQQKQGNNQGNQ